jgi:hypothetical protein
VIEIWDFSGDLCKMYRLVGCNVIEDWQKLPTFRVPISDTCRYCVLHHFKTGTEARLSYLMNVGAFPDLMWQSTSTQYLIREYVKIYLHFTLLLHSMVLRHQEHFYAHYKWRVVTFVLFSIQNRILSWVQRKWFVVNDSDTSSSGEAEIHCEPFTLELSRCEGQRHSSA